MGEDEPGGGVFCEGYLSYPHYLPSHLPPSLNLGMLTGVVTGRGVEEEEEEGKGQEEEELGEHVWLCGVGGESEYVCFGSRENSALGL